MIKIIDLKKSFNDKKVLDGVNLEIEKGKTTGLDPIMSDNIANLILDTQRDLKTTYIVITHDIPLTYKIADKIAMLHEGKIVEQGDVDYIKDCSNPVLRQFLEGKSEGPIKVL